MILVGNQRGGAKNLALHLLKAENERVDIHEIRGFASDDLVSALRESYAMSRATRCRQHLYSLSLNPPKDETVTDETFAAAIEKAELELGLTDQPRAIVFHTKAGLDGEMRRHAHAVWCRIDAQNMKAIQLSHDRRRLARLSKNLYLQHGWKMPRGHENPIERDPYNFSLSEWQQAKRAKKDPRALKALFQECWAQSDSRSSFTHAIKERGYILAKGDRRGFVAVDYKGEVYPVSRWVGIKAKDVAKRLGDLSNLPNVKPAHAAAAEIITRRLEELRETESKSTKERLAKIKAAQRETARRQRQEKQTLLSAQKKRQVKQQAAHEEKLRSGFLGLLDRITGRRKETLTRNEAEAAKSQEINQRQKQKLSQTHNAAMQMLKTTARDEQERHKSVQQELKADAQKLNAPVAENAQALKQAYTAKRKTAARKRIPRPRRQRPKLDR